MKASAMKLILICHFEFLFLHLVLPAFNWEKGFKDSRIQVKKKRHKENKAEGIEFFLCASVAVYFLFGHSNP